MRESKAKKKEEMEKQTTFDVGKCVVHFTKPQHKI